MPKCAKTQGVPEEPPLDSKWKRVRNAVISFILHSWAWDRFSDGTLSESCNPWKITIPGVYPLPDYYPDFVFRGERVYTQR